jgi:hypothetical protein
MIIGFIVAGTGFGLVVIVGVFGVLLAMSIPPTWPDDETRDSFAPTWSIATAIGIIGGAAIVGGLVTVAVGGVAYVAARSDGPHLRRTVSSWGSRQRWMDCDNCAFANSMSMGLVVCRN